MTDPGAAAADYTPPDLEPVHRSRRPQTRFGGKSIYAEPDPATVARLWRSHGAEAAYARWHWKSESELKVLRRLGEQRPG